MKEKVSTPVAIVVVVLVLAVVGFFAWRTFGPKGGLKDEKGIPMVPPEAKAGNDAMQKIFQQGVTPKRQPGR